METFCLLEPSYLLWLWYPRFALGAKWGFPTFPEASFRSDPNPNAIAQPKLYFAALFWTSAAMTLTSSATATALDRLRPLTCRMACTSATIACICNC
jgi:hypothetical protein